MGKKRNKLITIILLLVLVAGVMAFLFSETSGDAGKASTEPAQKKWKLVWSDEFNYKGLPDSNKWSYQVGYISDDMKEFYTEKRLQNAHVENGMLHITARKENFKNPIAEAYRKKYPGTGMPIKYRLADSVPVTMRNRFDSVAKYTSALLSTKDKATWTYGKIEFRAKVPQGNGMYAGGWMLGESMAKIRWPYCGEIDIMEHRGMLPTLIQSDVHWADTTLKKHKNHPQKATVNNLTNVFHVYGIEWNEQQIKFFIDGKVHYIFNVDDANLTFGDNPFKKPFYFILNFALGGKWIGRIDEKKLPQDFVVDYVRVYQ